MLKDSTGKELSPKSSYHIGEIEVEYSFRNYVDVDKTLALFSSKQPLTNGDPNERVLSQMDIETQKVYPALNSKDKNSGLESSVTQMSTKCIIEKS